MKFVFSPDVILSRITSPHCATVIVHTCFFFSKTFPDFFFLCWLWLTLVPVKARRMKKVILLDADSCVECPRNINRLKNMTCGMMTREMNNLEIE